MTMKGTVAAPPAALRVSPQQRGTFNRLSRLSNAEKLAVIGLVLTAAGMLLQIATGSKLYPSFAGPIVLLAAAVIVAFGPRRWTPYVALLIPLVLGLGAIIAAVMSGEFIKQLTDINKVGILLGSLMHVIGLIAAVASGVQMVLRRPG
jgi:hypothetical protein